MRLRPLSRRHPNIAVFSGNEEPECPVCGSGDLKQSGLHHTNVSVYNRFHCQECGAWSRDRYTINSRAKRKALLAS